VPYGRAEDAREINWENIVESWPWVLHAFLESLGQSRTGKPGRESPMISMTVMLFFCRDDAFPNDVRQGRFARVVNDRPCVSREGCVSPGGL